MTTSTTSTQQSSIIENHDAGLPQNASNPLIKKLRKGAKAKYIIEEHPIMDGTGKVVRTAHTGDVYHCFFYVRAEKKWLRKSLHTRKLSEALEAGRKLMMMTLAQIELGERVFNKTSGFTPRTGCTTTIITAHTWHWAASPQSSGWPWPLNPTSALC